MPHPWLAKRSLAFDSSGIRKVFDLAAKLKDPINLSIGQPDFPVDDRVKEAAIDAIRNDKNGYAPTQGILVLHEKLLGEVHREYDHLDRELLITSGTSGGLLLAILALVNPGEEVIVFDPYFVMYEPLVQMVGGIPIVISTYPDFRIKLDEVEAAISERTKLILFNSPANPTGVVATEDEVRGIADLAAKHNIALLSDEIYRHFCYDAPFISPARFNERTLVIDGFSKSHAITGWRLGYAHGPKELIETMAKLQQYTFVCAPQPVQWAGAAAMDVDMSGHAKDYQYKRDLLVAGLQEDYELALPSGAFYAFPRAPWGTGTEFVKAAIERGLLVIPGNVFSKQDTHFRISYAAADETIERGVVVLRELAKARP